jgi:A/G-specific adenine glycosylase
VSATGATLKPTLSMKPLERQGAGLHSEGLQASAVRRSLRRKLLGWYDAHKRELPWRATKDPYRIWISEIMLQQTRVAAATDYYLRFLTKFPSVEALASAPLDSVLAAWSGLGYYRRPRMMHQAAQKVVTEFGGEFPRTLEGLRELPGIGRYTAAAVASIAFGVPAAVVDGNVSRVFSRLTGRPLEPEENWQVAEAVLDKSRPGDFNQAVMELGATVCVPGEPACLACPVVSLCATRGALPTMQREPRLRREVWYAISCRNGSVFLVQRAKDASLMAGMWELPQIAARETKGKPEFVVKHAITVTDYSVKVVRSPRPATKNGRWMKSQEFQDLPLTGLARKILRRAEII